jgi:hypothetical protein
MTVSDLRFALLPTLELVRPFAPALLLGVAIFYLKHARYDVRRAWRYHARRLAGHWKNKRHFRCVAEVVLLLCTCVIALSPAVYALTEFLGVQQSELFAGL